jgi:hypothetical protein
LTSVNPHFAEAGRIRRVMISRSVRRIVARIAIVAVAFGQVALAAHACPLDGQSALVAVANGSPDHGNAAGPCGGMDAAPAAPDGQANLCEVHCTDAISVPGQPDLPPVVLAPLPTAAIAAAECVVADAAPDSISPVSGAPPLTLQFCRLLI